MKKFSFSLFSVVLILCLAGISPYQAQAQSLDFQSYTAGDSLAVIGWSGADVTAKIVDSSGNKVLQNTIRNYNAAPVFKLILPAGKTLANYKTFNFKGYFAQGDVGYKNIVVEAYQAKPTAQAFNTPAAVIGSWNRAKMGSTGWEDIKISIVNTSTIKDSVYIAFGINCAGTGDVGGTGVQTVWLADNIIIDENLVVIDGEKDVFYNTLTGPANGYLQMRAYNFSNNGAPLNDADLSAKVWAAWDSVWLYMYAEVMDNVISGTGAAAWQDDGMELKIDPKATDSVTNTIFAPNLTILGGAGSDSLNAFPANAKEYVRKVVTGGYVLEFKVLLDSINTGGEKISAKVDSVFGLGINFHDNDLDTRRASITWAAVMDDQIWSTAKMLGTVKFLAGNKLQFTAKNNMTGLTNPVPYDGSNYTYLGIVIDGQRDAFYNTMTGPDLGYIQMKSYNFSNNGIPTGDADLSAKVWAAWDTTWLYMYAEVLDDTIRDTGANSYQDDGMELKIDPKATDSVANSIFAPNFTILGGTGSDSLNAFPANAKEYSRRIMTGGYALEFKVLWDSIKSGTETISRKVDSVFGLGINFHDNDATTRQASVTWAAAMDDAIWSTVKMHGTVKFLANNRLQFIAKNNMTGLTNKAPYDGTPFYMRIDGQKDPFYYSLAGPATGYLQMQSSAFSTNGAPMDDKDLSAKVWAAWDPAWLYMYAEVKDDTIRDTGANAYQDDGMELKIDPKATDSVANSIFAPNLTILGGTGSDSLNAFPWNAKEYSRRTVTGGYVLEFKVLWDSIKSGTEMVSRNVDSVFGLGINFHDNDATTRQASVTWAAFLDDAIWSTSKLLGTVKFKSGNKLEFKSTNNMTGRTGHTQKYDGTDIISSVERVGNTVPATYSLGQNYPNPFNPSTTIQFSIPVAGKVRIELFNTIGQMVGEVVSGEFEAGNHKAIFNASHMASGVYFYRLVAGDFVNVKKLVLLK